MPYRLISILPLQLARLLGLVRAIEPAPLKGERNKPWVLVIRGRGFTRILRDEEGVLQYQFQSAASMLPRPMRFLSRAAAVRYAQGMRLLPARTRWSIDETGSAT